VAAERLDRFYRLIRTPVQPGEKIITACAVPVESEGGERAVFYRGYGFDLPMLSRESVVGFLVGWACVGAMIFGFWFMWQ
jgi:hypothetical protein